MLESWQLCLERGWRSGAQERGARERMGISSKERGKQNNGCSEGQKGCSKGRGCARWHFNKGKTEARKGDEEGRERRGGELDLSEGDGGAEMELEM